MLPQVRRSGLQKAESVIRQILPIANDLAVVIGTIFRCHEWDSIVNNFHVKRKGLEEFVTWMS